MPQVKPKTVGSSTRSMRIDAFSPPVHVISASPPGRRSIVAALPNQVPRPSAVVNAAHTLAGGCPISTVRSTRSGDPMTASGGHSNHAVATQSIETEQWRQALEVRSGAFDLLLRPGVQRVVDRQ